MRRSSSPPCREAGCRLALEPGRFIVGNAGVLVSQVIYTKREGGKKFIIQDAAMNDLVRPAMYDAFHRIWPARPRVAPPEDFEGALADCEPADVVGPICESGDYLAKDRSLPDVDRGDYLVTFSAGAYGTAMSSNYNSPSARRRGDDRRQVGPPHPPPRDVCRPRRARAVSDRPRPDASVSPPRPLQPAQPLRSGRLSVKSATGVRAGAAVGQRAVSCRTDLIDTRRCRKDRERGGAREPSTKQIRPEVDGPRLRKRSLFCDVKVDKIELCSRVRTPYDEGSAGRPTAEPFRPRGACGPRRRRQRLIRAGQCAGPESMESCNECPRGYGSGRWPWFWHSTPAAMHWRSPSRKPLRRRRPQHSRKQQDSRRPALRRLGRVSPAGRADRRPRSFSTPPS